MKALKILVTLTIALFFTNCSKGQNVETVSVNDFESKLKATENAQLLDVRTTGEYTEGHLDKAKNIDWNGDSFETEVQKLDKSKPVFVYCLVGGRSKKASSKLKDVGFTTVYNLDGGYMKWSEARPKTQ